MGSLSIGHWLIILLIAVLLFGTKKLGNIGGDLASAIKSFRKGLQEDDQGDPAKLKADAETPAQTGAESKQEEKH